MSAKAKLLARSSLLRITSFFINAIIAFAMMPFVIRSLGDTMYGLWIFIGSFLNFYGLFDLGFGSAVQRYVSRAIGSKDYKEANIVINTSLLLFGIIGIIVFLFSIAAAFFVPVFVKNITEIVLFRQIILILGASLALNFPMKVFSGTLTSQLRYDVTTVIGISKLILRTLLVIVFLKLGYGILALALITLFTDLFFYVISYSFARRIGGYLVISKQFIHLVRIKKLFHYSIFTFINQISDKLRFGIDHFVITFFMGLSYVTVYSIASRLMLYFIDFISTSIGILTPVFSQYESRGDYHSIREKFILTTKISSFLAILIGGILLIFGKAFIIRWVGVEYKYAYTILIVLIIPLISALMQSPSVQVVYGISKHKYFAISNSIEGVANLILSVILIKKFGLLGVALGTAIPMLIIKIFVQPVYTCRVIKLNLSKYYFKIVIPIVIKSTITLTMLWLATRKVLFPNYLNLSILILSTIMIFSFYIFFFGLKHSERSYVRKVILKPNN